VNGVGCIIFGDIVPGVSILLTAVLAFARIAWSLRGAEELLGGASGIPEPTTPSVR
jgi:hypothetical protein